MIVSVKKEYEETLSNFIEKQEYKEALNYLNSIEQYVSDLVWIHYQRGVVYNLAALYHLALFDLLKANMQLEDDVDLLCELGWTYNRLEDYSTAIEYLEKANMLSRDDYWINAELAFSYLSLNLKEEAIVYLINALEHYPGDSWANTWLAHTYKDLGDLEQANLIYNELYQSGNEDLDVLESLIITNEVLQKFENQLEILDNMQQLNINNNFVYLHKGMYFNLIGYYNEAIEVLGQISVEKEEVFLEQAYAYKNIEEYDLAIMYYQKALKNQKDSTFILSELVYLYDVTENYFDKENCLKQLYTQKCQELWVYSHFIRLYLYDLINNELAHEFLIEATKKYEQNEELKYLWIEYYYISNQIEMARECIKNILLTRSNCANYNVPYFQLDEKNMINLDEINRIYEFSEGLAYIENKNQSGFIDENGQLVIDFQFEKDYTNNKNTYMFYQQQAIVCQDHLFGVINKEGEFIHEPIYDNINFIKDGLYAKLLNHSFLFSNKTKQFDFEIGEPSEGMIAFRENNLWGYMDYDQKVIILPQFEKAYCFNEGYAKVVKDGKVGYINNQGAIAIECMFDSGGSVCDRLIVVQKEKYYGIIDIEGNEVLEINYDFIEESHNGDYIIWKDKKAGCFNVKRTLILPQYDHMLPFFEGLARIKIASYYGAINENNQLVVDCIYDKMTILKHGLMIVGIGYRYGYMNNNGKMCTPIMFQTATLTGEKVMSVSFNQKFYLLNIKNIIGGKNE